MRILKVTQAYDPFLARGGPAIKVRSIARGLVSLGHQVTVLTADLGFGPAEISAAAALKSPHQGWRSERDDIETIYLTTRARYRNLTINPGVLRFCHSRLPEFDVVHIYGLYDTLGPAVARVCRRLSIPYIVEPLGMLRPIDRGFFLKNLWKGMNHTYLHRADKIVTTCEMERGEVLAEGFLAQRVQLRYNGVELDEFRMLPVPGSFRAKLGLTDAQRFVLFLGRIIPRKGADLLIEAMPRLQNKSLKLVVAGPEGESGYVNSLRNAAKSRGVESLVLFPGPLYGEDKKAAIVDAALFALPSRYENFGNSAAEAIACGTPVIVSDQCGIASLIDGRAGLVCAYNADSLLDCLSRMLSEESLRRTLASGCPQVAQELSWSRLIHEVEDTYLQLTGKMHEADSARRSRPVNLKVDCETPLASLNVPPTTH